MQLADSTRCSLLLRILALSTQWGQEPHICGVRTRICGILLLAAYSSRRLAVGKSAKLASDLIWL